MEIRRIAEYLGVEKRFEEGGGGVGKSNGGFWLNGLVASGKVMDDPSQ